MFTEMYSRASVRGLFNVYLWIALVVMSQTDVDAETCDLSYCLFVSHQSGQDSPQCGSLNEPCQTLPQALLMVSDGGKICLDGTDSESHPYSCEQMDGTKKIINKNLTIQGWLSKAHISCKRSDSLTFKQARNCLLRLTLSNLVFYNHGLRLPDVSCFDVLITNCKFMNCKTAVGILQEESTVCRKSSLVISDTEFFYNNISVLACLFNGSFTVNISRCVFQGKKGRFNGISGDKKTTAAVYVKLLGSVHASGFIVDSSFRDLSHEDNGFALSFRAYHIFITGSLSVLNTTFLNNENGIFVAGGFDVRIVQTTINSTYGYALIACGPPKIIATAADIRVLLDHCLLSNNRIGIRMAANPCLPGGKCAPSSQILVVKNSLFFGGNETKVFGDAIRFVVQQVFSVYRPPFIKGVVILENVTFQKIQNCAMYVGIQKNVKGLIFVKNCKFLNNSQFVYHLDERPTVNIVFEEGDPPKCLKRNRSSKFIWNNTSQIPVIFENSIFEANVAVSGALNFVNGNVTLKNCTFKDNEGLTLGGHVYMKTGFGSFNIVNSTFLQTRLNRPSNTKQRQISSNVCFLYSESVGPVIITNTSFTAIVSRTLYPIFAATKSSSIKIDASSSLQCSPGRRVKLDNIDKNVIEGLEFTEGRKTCWINVNYVKLFCEECPNRFYSLQRGMVTGLNINKGTECLKCPFGASCENGNVKAKENFWGSNISTSPPSLQFFPCPLEYCSSPKNSSHNTYNGCHGSRTGVLCGKCSNGYSESLYSTLCRKNEKCNDHWFWLATAIYVVVFSIYFLFKPPIFTELLKQSLWFKKKPENIYIQPLPYEHDAKNDCGYLKIMFYFYQVAELVMISSPEKTLHMVPIIPPVIAIFNFQVKTLNGSIGCPFPGLTVVTKELFQCLKFLGTLLSIGFIYAIHRVASTSRYISAPSLTLYLAVALETLLLGYETLADTALKLMHCVPIEMNWRLFVDGNIQCWQWWQYLLIAFIVAFIVPLILVLFWGSLMLANDKVTAKEFLTACAFPLPCLVAWFIRHCRKTEDEELLFVGNVNDAEEIKEVLHGPFREASNSDHGTLYWESVLTGRRLVLLTIHTFATDPMIRFVCLNCACVLILIHHVTMKPFRDRKANICEGLSLMSLTVICTFSFTEATYISRGIDPTGPNLNLFHAFQWIEIGLLSLVPAAMCVLVAFAAGSQVARLLYHCIRCLSHAVRHMCQIQEPSMPRQLLLNWDLDELSSVC